MKSTLFLSTPKLPNLKWSWPLRLLFAFICTSSLFGFFSLWLVSTQTLNSIQKKLEQSLGGHLALVTRGLWNNEDRIKLQTLFPDSNTSLVLDLFTMAKSSKWQGLVNLRVIDDHYPLLPDEENWTELPGKVFVSPSMQEWLGGEKVLKLGSLQFPVESLKNDDIFGEGLRFGNLAPRVYVHIEDAKKTGLITPLSTVTSTILLTFSDQKSITLDQNLQKEIRALWPQKNFQIFDPKSFSERLTGPIEAWNHGSQQWNLLALLIGIIGLSLMAQLHLQRHHGMLELYLYQGLTFKQLRILLFRSWNHIWIFSIFLGLLVFVPFWMILGIGQTLLSKEVFKTFSFITLGFWGSTRWGSYSYFVNQILGEICKEKKEQNSYYQYFAFFYPSLFFILASWIITKNVKLISGFLLILLLLGAVTFLILKIVISFIKMITENWMIDFLVSRWKHCTLFFSYLLGLPTAIWTLFGMVLWGTHYFHKEYLTPKDYSPQIFAFDIPDEEWEEFQKKVASFGASLLHPSPLLRGRVLSWSEELLNQPAREEAPNPSLESSTGNLETDHRFWRLQGLNITIRDQLTPSEEVVKRLSKPLSSKILPLSVERRWAKRVGVQLGDDLILEIASMTFPAKVIEVRKISWQAFLPNFFVQIPSGHVDEAPKIWISGIRCQQSQTKDLIHNLGNHFPSVTFIDVKEFLGKIKKLTRQLQKSLSFSLVLLTLCALGLIIPTMMILLDELQKETSLLEALGLNGQNLVQLRLIEFSLTLISPILAGSLLSSLFYQLFLWLNPFG